MAFLLDTIVLSELRKKRRNEPKVQGWLSSVDSEDLFTSVIVVGEIRSEAYKRAASIDGSISQSTWNRISKLTFGGKRRYDQAFGFA